MTSLRNAARFLGVQRAGPAAVFSSPAAGAAAVVLGRGMATVIDGLKYASSHEWVKVEGDEATIGVTDFAQSELGDVVYVEVPEVGTEFGSTGESFGVLESTKAARCVGARRAARAPPRRVPAAAAMPRVRLRGGAALARPGAGPH